MSSHSRMTALRRFCCKSQLRRAANRDSSATPRPSLLDPTPIRECLRFTEHLLKWREVSPAFRKECHSLASTIATRQAPQLWQKCPRWSRSTVFASGRTSRPRYDRPSTTTSCQIDEELKPASPPLIQSSARSSSLAGLVLDAFPPAPPVTRHDACPGELRSGHATG
jgi:hypothetical protein